MDGQQGGVPESGEGFDEGGFWAALAQYSRRLGRAIVEKSLIAYYVARDPATPPWARAALVGALTYLALPIDAIPDVVPLIGLTDDVSVLLAALAAVAVCVTDEHIRQARARMESWGVGAGRSRDLEDETHGDDPCAA